MSSSASIPHPTGYATIRRNECGGDTLGALRVTNTNGQVHHHTTLCRRLVFLYVRTVLACERISGRSVQHGAQKDGEHNRSFQQRAICEATLLHHHEHEQDGRQAASSTSAGGEIARDGSRPSGPPAAAPSAAGSVYTSSGKIRWETPRLRIALLQARFANSECLLVYSTVCDHCATLPKAAARSTSWKAPAPST